MSSRGLSIRSDNHLTQLRINAEWNAAMEHYGKKVASQAMYYAKRSAVRADASYWCEFVLRGRGG